MRTKEPMIAAMKEARKAFNESPAGRAQALLEEERKWRRRATIATNKLGEIREEINDLLREQVTPPADKAPAA